MTELVKHITTIPQFAGCRWAFVVEDAASAGWFHLVSAFGKPFVFCTFTDIDEAKLWLSAARHR